jgi:hypothetical protein
MKHVITEKDTAIMRAIRVLLTVVLIFGMLGLKAGMSFGESPEPGSLVIDPNSISTDNEKEGNILAEQGFSFFTEESMSEMNAAKEKEEKARQEAIDGLFLEDRQDIENYDEYVNEVIKAGDLFSSVNTGVEIVEPEGAGRSLSPFWMRSIVTGILMCLISAVAIAYIRKRNESKRNHKTRK